MSFWVYILRCADNSYYTGHTDDLEKRIAEDKAGEIEGYTSTRLPVELVFSQEFSSREEAKASERQIKGWNRRKKEALIKGDWAEVSRLAHSKKHPSTLRLSSGLRMNGYIHCYDWLNCITHTGKRENTSRINHYIELALSS